MGYVLQLLVAALLAVCYSSCVLAQSTDGDDLVSCDGSTQKIRASWVCDGYPDCPLGTDERRCAINCNEEEFACNDGQCVRYSWVCDSRLDCDDGSDEREEICAMTISDSCHNFQFDCTNGRCIRRGYVCDGHDDCGNGLDESDCATPPSSVPNGPGAPPLDCDVGFFPCEDRSQCVSNNWVCDGEGDCGDSSDETQDHCGLPITECGFGFFNCTQGGCIDINLVCDGNPSCSSHGDTSDEDNCPVRQCTAQEFQCPLAVVGCIPEAWVCDGEDDCGDEADELQCDAMCARNEYACQSGECVPSSQVCDGVLDCEDGSDEYKCPLPPPPINCAVDEFRCLNNHECVSSDAVCDGVRHCSDGSDENTTLCDTSTSASGLSPVGCEYSSCAHNCVAALHSASGYFCTCDYGYVLNGSDFTSCMDYNECEEPDRCSQVCRNLDGGYECSCVDGYEAVPTGNGTMCMASDGPQAKLLFANRVDIRAVRVTGRSPELLVKHLHNAIAIDFHYRLGYMYWTDIVQETINRAWLNGSNVTTIVSTEMKDPVGLSVDWVNDKLYWADAGRGRIEVSDLNGTNRTVLFANDIGILRAVVVDPMSRYFFWTDWGDSPRIERASMDGQDRTTLHSHFIKWPNALTIDYATQTLYWADAKLLTLESSFIDGSNRRPIRTSGLRHPFAMTMFEDMLYISDWQMKAIYETSKFAREFSYDDGRHVYQDLLTMNETVVQLHGGLYFPMDVKVLHPLRQPSSSNPCDHGNGGCQYLCLLSAINEQGYSCACPAGIRLAEDGKHCESLENFILFARRTAILRVSLDVPEFVDVPLPLANLSGATAIDWDDQTDKIFWTDLVQDTINSANSDGTNQTILIGDNLYTPAGLAVDWLTRKIYWTEHVSAASRIEVANMDGSDRAIVVLSSSDNPIDKPRDIVVHPLAGLMFWTDWGRDAKIERANLDGSNRSTIVTQNLTYPNGLGIDYESNLLYWCDARYNTIEYSDFYGRGRTVVIHDTGSAHPFGLTIYQNQIYWTDWSKESIHVADKLTGLDRRVLFSNLDNRPMDIHVYHRNRSRGESPCGDSNGGCSHHCLSRPSDTHPGQLAYSCSCPVGHKLLDDGRTCRSIIESYLLFPTGNRLHEISLDTSDEHLIDFVVDIPNFQAATSVDVDLQTGDIYWADRLESKIFKFSRSEGTKETIIDIDIVAPESIAIDWIGRKLYWADSLLRRIEVCNLNGTTRRVLFSRNLYHISSIAIDLESFHLFWTDAGNPLHSIAGKIERADMDGRNREAIVTSRVGSPMSVAVYNPTGLGGRIYWTDTHHGTIDSTDIHGRDRFNLITFSSSDRATPSGLAVEGDYIYWTDTYHNSINRARRIDGSEHIKIRDRLPSNSVSDIRVIKNSDLSRRTDGLIVHPCDGTSQGCSDLCLPNPGLAKYSCQCPTGITLTEDDKTCHELPPIYMLIASHTTVRRISLDPQVNDLSDVSIIRGLNLTLALDYRLTSVGQGEIIFADKTLNKIYASNLDGSDVHPIVSSISSVEGLAYDWIGQNIYWVDNERRTLEVSRYDGSSRRILIHGVSGYLSQPRGIAVDPYKGFLVIADWGARKIFSTKMDGSSIRFVITTDLFYPNGITLDREDLRIYWADAFYNKVESSTYDGRDRVTHVSHGSLDDTFFPYAVLFFNGFIFWSNVLNDTLHRAKVVDNKFVNHAVYRESIRSPSQFQIVSDQNVRPGELSMTGLSYQSACYHDNGGCAYLCLATAIDERRCVCPDDLPDCDPQIHTDEPTTASQTESVTKETTEEEDTPTTIPPIKLYTLSGPDDNDVVTVAGQSPVVGSQGELSTAIVASMVVIALVLLIIVFVVVLVTAVIIRRQKLVNERQLLQLASMRRLNATPVLNSMNPTQRVSGTYTNSNPELVIGNLLPKRNNLNSAYPRPPPPPLQTEQEKSKQKSRFHFHRNSSSSLKRGSANVANTNVYREEPEVYQLPPKPQPKRKISVPDSPLFKPALKPPAPPPPGTEEVGVVFVEKEDLSLSTVPPSRPPKKSTSSETCSSADNSTPLNGSRAGKRRSKSREKSCERGVHFDPSLPKEEEPPPLPPRAAASPVVPIPPSGGVVSSGRKKSKSPPIPMRVVTAAECTPEDESVKTPPTIHQITVDVEPISDVGGDSSSVDGGVSDCTASTELGHEVASDGMEIERSDKRSGSPASCESSC